MAIAETHKHNFAELERAFNNGDVCVVECTMNATGEQVPVLCIGTWQEGEFVMQPVAQMFTENPYDLLTPPS